MNEPAPNQQLDGFHLLALASSIAILSFLYKASPALSKFWERHRFALIALAVWLLMFGLFVFYQVLRNKYFAHQEDLAITSHDATSVYLGQDAKGNLVHLKQKYRTSHTQVIGTTNAGKTESVILPWAIQDIRNRSGMLIIDGKSDRSFLDKLYSYVVESGRKDQFRLFSLAHLPPSSTFNPLVGSSVQEVAERVFSSFPIEQSYYRVIQSKIFLALLTLIQDRGKVPTFALVHRLLTDKDLLVNWLTNYELINELNHHVLDSFADLPTAEKLSQVSGLEGNLTHFAQGGPSVLFNSEQPDIRFDEVLDKNLICYFQLPTMYYPFLAEATGKLVLQTFQNAVAKRHLGLAKEQKYFSCFLDDFQDYLYPGFASLLNKSRSANIGVVFSHQALGDLDKVDPSFRNIVSTCTNIKVVMRTTDPETCDFFAKTFGTESTEKITERQTKGVLGTARTGEGSVREVEQYIVHPKELRNLARGQGVVTIPHQTGIKTLKINFQKCADLKPEELSVIKKKPPVPPSEMYLPDDTKPKA